MVKLKDLCTIIDSLGIPWANTAFAGEEPEPPFIVLVAGFSEAAYADGINWKTWMPYDIALYTRHRDYANEKKIAVALDAAEIPYEKSVTMIQNENLIETAFEVDVDEEMEE